MRSLPLPLLPLLLACSRAAAPGDGARTLDLEALAQHERLLVGEEAGLAAALAAAGAPDCDRACGHAREICALAGRICVIAVRRPDDPEVQGRCRDAEARCRRARDSVATRCGCN